MNWRELIAGTIWGAALIAVAQATWEAYTQTYQPFPLFGSGGLSASAGLDAVNAGIGTDLQGVATGHAPADKAGSSRISQPGSSGIFGGVINTITNFLGITSPPDQSVPTKNRPPRNLDLALSHAVSSGNKTQAVMLVKQVITLQKSKGWSQADIQAWASSRPWSSGLAAMLAGL